MLLLLSLAACHPNDDGPPPAETDADTDTDSDTDTDTDSDTDTDTDSDTDTATTLPLGADCDETSDCGEGAGCCTACCAVDATPVCTELDGSGGCPLPDLTVDADRLSTSIYAENTLVEETDCALVDECVGGAGWRRLLRFTTAIPNNGTGDLTLGEPSSDPDHFVYSECHGHYHYVDFITYTLYDGTGTIAATGRKQAFCLMDAEPWSETPGTPKFFCGKQGITVGWADTYGAELDCQWLDITDVVPGDYTLTLTVDPNAQLSELSTADNVVSVPVTIEADTSVATDACAAPAYGELRDCGWADAGTFACTPGEEVTLGCDGACDGGCVGDPVLRLCDAADPDCTAMEALGSNDDASCGASCSELTVTCPDSGSIQALTGAWDSTESATCSVTAG